MRKKTGKLVAVFLVVLMLCALFPLSAAFAADEWEGYTAISSQEDLEKIADDMSGKYYLTTDITMEGIWSPLVLVSPVPIQIRIFQARHSRESLMETAIQFTE